MNKTLIAALSVTLVLAGLIPLAAATFPLNGGFEEVVSGSPVAWQTSGSWLPVTSGPYQGRRCVVLPGVSAHAGDRLVSGGYLLVEPGQTLNLRLAYRATGEGAVAGLVHCDSLGRPLGKETAVSLSPAEAWTVVEYELTLAEELCAPPVAAVRLFLGVNQAGVEVEYDAVSLAHQTPSLEGASRVAPKLDVLSRPNLAPNPNLRLSPEGKPLAWSEATGVGFVSGVATPTEADPTAGLRLRGQDLSHAWLSDPVGVDAALPYQASVRVVSAHVVEGRLSLLVRATDVRDPRIVWLQSESHLEETCPPVDLVAHLGRLWPESTAAQAQLVLVLDPASEAEAVFTSPRLGPEPITLTIRPVSMATEFRRTQDVNLFISAVNNTTLDVAPMAYMKVFGAEEKEVFYDARRLKISRQSAAYFPLRPTLPGPGEYSLLVRLMFEGKDIGSATFDFRVTGP